MDGVGCSVDEVPDHEENSAAQPAVAIETGTLTKKRKNDHRKEATRKAKRQRKNQKRFLKRKAAKLAFLKTQVKLPQRAKIYSLQQVEAYERFSSQRLLTPNDIQGYKAIAHANNMPIIALLSSETLGFCYLPPTDELVEWRQSNSCPVEHEWHDLCYGGSNLAHRSNIASSGRCGGVGIRGGMETGRYGGEYLLRTDSPLVRDPNKPRTLRVQQPQLWHKLSRLAIIQRKMVTPLFPAAVAERQVASSSAFDEFATLGEGFSPNTIISKGLETAPHLDDDVQTALAVVVWLRFQSPACPYISLEEHRNNGETWAFVFPIHNQVIHLHDLTVVVFNSNQLLHGTVFQKAPHCACTFYGVASQISSKFKKGMENKKKREHGKAAE